jgi:hypothetical protein
MVAGRLAAELPNRLPGSGPCVGRTLADQRWSASRALPSVPGGPGFNLWRRHTATQLQRLAVCSLRLRTGQIVVYYQLIQDVKLTLLGQGEVAQGVVGGRCLRMARQHGGRRPVEAVRGQPEVTPRRSYVTSVAVAVVHHV